jgi:hypothetical protein
MEMSTTTTMQERRRRLQIHELDSRIYWLKDHLRRLSDTTMDQRVLYLWKRELKLKLEQKLLLLRGVHLPDKETRACVSAAAILRGRPSNPMEHATFPAVWSTPRRS